MFDQLRGNGRVWVYTANRALTAEEQQQINAQMSDFCAQWNAHGNQLIAQFEILYDQILVLAADEDVEAASGCSIDSATNVFRAIDQNYKLDLFNRLNLAFIKDDKIRIVSLSDLNQAYHSGVITKDSLLLDNSLGQLSDLRSRWQVPLAESWAFRRIKKLVEEA